MLDDAIRTAVPELERGMGYGIGYGPIHYKYASGREGDTHLISLMSQKNYISIYVFAEKDGVYLAEARRADFPKASIGKSCIRIKKAADIDMAALSELCREAVTNQPTFDSV